MFKFDLDYDDATEKRVPTASVVGFSANYNNETDIEIPVTDETGVEFDVTKIELGSFDDKQVIKNSSKGHFS